MSIVSLYFCSCRLILVKHINSICENRTFLVIYVNRRKNIICFIAFEMINWFRMDKCLCWKNVKLNHENAEHFPFIWCTLTSVQLWAITLTMFSKNCVSLSSSIHSHTPIVYIVNRRLDLIKEWFNVFIHFWPGHESLLMSASPSCRSLNCSKYSHTW